MVSMALFQFDMAHMPMDDRFKGVAPQFGCWLCDCTPGRIQDNGTEICPKCKIEKSRSSFHDVEVAPGEWYCYTPHVDDQLDLCRQRARDAKQYATQSGPDEQVCPNCKNLWNEFSPVVIRDD